MYICQCVRVYVHTRIRIHTHVRTSERIHKCTHTHIHTYTYTHVQTDISTLYFAHTNTHKQTHPHTHTHAHTHSHRCRVSERLVNIVRMCGSALQCVTSARCSKLQHAAACWSVLQCVGVCCSVLPCVAVCRYRVSERLSNISGIIIIERRQAIPGRYLK